MTSLYVTNAGDVQNITFHSECPKGSINRTYTVRLLFMTKGIYVNFTFTYKCGCTEYVPDPYKVWLRLWLWVETDALTIW